MFKRLHNEQLNQYSQLWECSNDAHLFQSYEWLKNVVVDDQELQLWGFFEASDLIAAFPLVKIKSRLFTLYSQPYLTPYLGYFTAGDNGMENKIQQGFNSTLQSIKKDNLFCALPPWQEFTFNHNKVKIKSHLTHTIDLKEDESIIFSNFKSDKKRNVKNALKEGLTVSFDRNPDILKLLIQKTYDRQEKENSWLNTGIKLAQNFKNAFQVTVFKDTIPLSTLFIAYANNRAYYMYGGYDESHNNYNAGPFAMYHAILKSKSLGLDVFDFEGSEIEPIQKYFQRFGPKEERYKSVEFSSLKFNLYRKIS